MVRFKTGGTGGPETAYLHADHLGSPVAATDETGAILWAEHFTPYGTNIPGPAANPDDEGFTGHIQDTDTGLTYMQARYYDPHIGRFLSNDPVGFEEGLNPAYFNRYWYAGGDPINAYDPNGGQIEQLDDENDFSFSAMINNESSTELSNEELQALGNQIAETIDNSFSGSLGLFQGKLSLTSSISVGNASSEGVQISIVDEITDENGEVIPNISGVFEGDFGEGGNIKITTFAIEKADEVRTGAHEFGHAFGNLRHPLRTTHTLMDQSRRSRSTLMRPDQRRRAVKSFRNLAEGN